ncbi:hypothetical protein MRX96_021367 [Rhipicephalus microplus]
MNCRVRRAADCNFSAHLNNASPKRINFVERALLCPQDSTIAPSWMQIDLERTSEDCLYLSLWTPDTQCLFQGRDCGTRPVIVFFHGGDLSHGGNRVYDGAVLSSKADAVVAIPNYRLGLLGHFTGNESELLFLGLGDQLTAVRWLRENVGFFGGNASRMVLAGHGAGAASVGHWILGTQPEIADVQRFVMISGSPYARYMKDADVTTKNMRILARRVQCESFDEVCSVEEILPCLRRFPSSVLGVDNVSVFLDNYQRELGTTNLDVARSEAYADVRSRCPMRRFAERMTSSDLSVHWFVFNAKPSFEESYLRSEDASHYSTVRLLLTDLGNVRPTGEDIVVRDSFVRTLGSFVNTGQVIPPRPFHISLSEIFLRVHAGPYLKSGLPNPGDGTWVPQSCLPTAFIEIDATHRWRDCVPHVDVGLVDVGLVNACDVALSSRATDASGSTCTPLA